MNAKEELLEILEGKAKVKCALVSREDDDPKIILKVNYNMISWENFLKELDFDYYNGYGGQELFGTVWLDDNTWLSRGEYDGSEWWQHNALPPVPIELF